MNISSQENYFDGMVISMKVGIIELPTARSESAVGGLSLEMSGIVA